MRDSQLPEKASLEKVPSFLGSFAKVFEQAGFQCFLVGGAVRNIALGSPPEDFDITTDALPDQVQTLFRRTIPTGIEHGTVTVLFKGRRLEVTTFRTEEGYSDGRRPDKVHFAGNITDDLSRRDLTVNAMALDLLTGEFLDPFGGIDDIRNAVIRTVGDAAERFREDGLRLLRALRFSAVLDFSVEPKTAHALELESERIRSVSAERVRDELLKLLSAGNPIPALKQMAESGMLSVIIPELDACRGFAGGGDYDLFSHLLHTAVSLPSDRTDLRFAGLLHDIGKVRCRTRTDDGTVHYEGHDSVGADMAETLLRRLKLPNRTITGVAHLIRMHMFEYDPESTGDAAVRRLISRVGLDSFEDLLCLREADNRAKTRTRITTTAQNNIQALRSHAERVLAADHALRIKDLRISGHDLAEEGIPKGPEMGTVMSALLETVLDDPTQNTNSTLRTIARNYYKTRVAPGRDS